MNNNSTNTAANIITVVMFIAFILSFKYIAALFIVILFFFLIGLFSMIF